MPRHELETLSNDARIWIFGIDPALNADGERQLLDGVDRFLAEWSAHGTPVVSARHLIDGRFLVIAAEKDAETSGCSIDRMFPLVRDAERALRISVLDASLIFHRDADGRIKSVKRGEFRDVANQDTVVFDTTAQTLGEIRNGTWVRRAADSWHAALLRQSA